MSQVITFLGYTPAPRYDGNPWTEIDVEEAALEAGPWTVIETIAISPVDADPEFPASRSLTTENASDTLGLWYRLVFRDLSGDEEQPTLPVQNVAGRAAYATVDELARILKVSASQRWQSLRRVIEAAAFEIDQELDLVEPYASPPALVVQVNLQRAAEWWFLQEVPLGLAGIGSEFGSTHLARNSWDKYAFMLAPLKEQWGLA